MSSIINPLGNLSNVGSLGSWVDAVDQENRHSAQKRVEVIKDGIKTVIDFIEDEAGGKSKVITTYKVIHKKVPRVVAERKKWKKFGASVDDEPGPNISTTYVADSVEIQFLNRFAEQQDEFDEKTDSAARGQSSRGHCRFCKSDDHWSVNCPYKEMFKDSMMEEEQDTADKSGSKFAGTMPGRYIPPSQRGGATGERTALVGGERHSDDYTVRITNLPEDSDTLEDDLRRMFSEAGRIVRFYLARDKVTSRPKGFAFVTFATSADAEQAINKFNGAKMEHLILKVEWTK